MNTHFVEQSKPRCKTENEPEGDYPFYMREIERNIVYCHQKSKIYKRKTRSLTKTIPLHFKCARQTAIDFDEVPFNKDQTHPLTKENNGHDLYSIIDQIRNEQNQTKTLLSSTAVFKQLQTKLDQMKKHIEQKKAEKKAQKKKAEKKENSFYTSMLKEQERHMMMLFGSVKPLKTTNRLAAGQGFLPEQCTLDKLMRKAKKANKRKELAVC